MKIELSTVLVLNYLKILKKKHIDSSSKHFLEEFVTWCSTQETSHFNCLTRIVLQLHQSAR